MFGSNPQMSQMMPLIMQMMQQGQSPASGMPQVGNSAPQIPVRQGQQPGGAVQPPPLPQQGQQNGFFQNMMSSPSQMSTGMGLMNKAGSGLNGLFGGAPPAAASGGMDAAAQPFFGGAASGMMPFGAATQGAAGASGIANFMAPMAGAAPTAAVSAMPAAGVAGGAAGATGSSPFWGGLSSMMGGGGGATGLLSLLGLA